MTRERQISETSDDFICFVDTEDDDDSVDNHYTLNIGDDDDMFDDEDESDEEEEDSSECETESEEESESEDEIDVGFGVGDKKNETGTAMMDTKCSARKTVNDPATNPADSGYEDKKVNTI